MTRTDLDQDASDAEFERCFRAHYADVLAFARRRLTAAQTADDAAAETFAVAWRRREAIPAAPLPWLYGIALRVIANQRRSERRRRNLAQRLAGTAVATEVADPGEALHQRTEFAAAFARLGDSDRELLSLVAWDGLEPREAARALGCSHGAFRVRFHRARRRLRRHLAAVERSHPQTCPRPPGPAEEAS
ncbi:MAG: sigma-70 family RNA polymerase sigma factor [Solirubrobacterales bacterium]